MDFTLDTMIQHLQLGFDIDLYEPWEYPSIFWYLDTLASHRHFNQQHVLKYNEFQRQKLKAIRNKKGGTRGGRGGAGATHEPPATITQTAYSHELDIRTKMSKAVMQMLGYAYRVGKLPIDPPNTALGSPETRYWRRFAPFRTIPQPQQLPFHKFDAGFLKEADKQPVRPNQIRNDLP